MKYQFTCSCCRCYGPPLSYTDHFLEGKSSIILNQDFSDELPWEEFEENLERALNQYMFDGDPDACCSSLEALLSHSLTTATCSAGMKSCHLVNPNTTFFRNMSGCFLAANSLTDSILKDEFGSNLNPKYVGSSSVDVKHFQLLPWHYIFLNVYIALASVYRVRADGILAHHFGAAASWESFKLMKVATAYSLLLAGVINHLFLSECSLIMPAAQFWVTCGESLVELFRSLKDNPVYQNAPTLYLPCHSSQQGIHSEGSCHMEQFDSVCKGFNCCIGKTSSIVWAFLVEDSFHLKYIDDPVNFSEEGQREKSQGKANICHGKETISSFVYNLAVHALLYGSMLANACYGPHCYLVGRVRGVLSDPYMENSAAC